MGEQAAALGWTTQDLFGLQTVPDAPTPSYRRLSRYAARLENLRQQQYGGPALKHRNLVPTHRQSPYKILDEAQFPSEVIFFGLGPAVALISLSWEM
jgi:hypothetical protein